MLELYRIVISLGKSDNFRFNIHRYTILKEETNTYTVSNTATGAIEYLTKDSLGKLTTIQKDTKKMSYTVWLNQQQYLDSNYGNTYVLVALEQMQKCIHQNKRNLKKLEKKINTLRSMSYDV